MLWSDPCNMTLFFCFFRERYIFFRTFQRSIASPAGDANCYPTVCIHKAPCFFLCIAIHIAIEPLFIAYSFSALRCIIKEKAVGSYELPALWNVVGDVVQRVGMSFTGFVNAPEVGSMTLCRSFYLWLNHDLGEVEMSGFLANAYGPREQRTSIEASIRKMHEWLGVNCPALPRCINKDDSFFSLRSTSTSHCTSSCMLLFCTGQLGLLGPVVDVPCWLACHWLVFESLSYSVPKTLQLQGAVLPFRQWKS